MNIVIIQQHYIYMYITLYVYAHGIIIGLYYHCTIVPLVHLLFALTAVRQLWLSGKLCVSVTSGRGQNHVWKLRGRGDLGHPAVVALQGPSHGHLLGHLGARYRSMAVD